jgi:hypothetical protein
MPRKKATRPSELAAMVAGCQTDSSSLPVLADWLDERLGLPHTAGLLRLPALQQVPQGVTAGCRQFSYFPLAPDAFVWLADVRPLLEGDDTPGVILGLYAHPQGRPGAWARLARLLAFQGETDPRVEAARAELNALAERAAAGSEQDPKP